MNPQPLQLDLGRLTPVVPDPSLTIQQRFEQFHRDNDWVFDALVKLARDANGRGLRYGAKALFEVLRWEYGRQTTGEPWKLNNDFTSRYARLIEASCPDLADYFRTRELRAA